jgi:flagellar basal-body rod modification protein FlgD
MTDAVSGISAQGANAAQSAAAKASLDYTAFLRLLVAEMKNQDPTNPNDATQYMSQLASFSNVEQSIQINSKLAAMMTSQALSQADGLIGRTVTSADGLVSGKIAAFTIQNGGAVAILENGTKLALGDGVVVS